MESLLDVPGLRVGHAQRIGDGWLTGVTAVLAPPGTAGGCDVRGGGPGTIETDALDPSTLVQTVDGVALCGGSAYGLTAATGVQLYLESIGQGYGVLGGVVPIVPGAVIFDLGRGGDFAARPDTAMGFAAAAAAVGLGEIGPADGLNAVRAGAARPNAAGAGAAGAYPADDAGLRGCVGAGTGAVLGRGQYKGGVGMASQALPGGPVPGPPGAPEVVLPEGIVVGALAVVNAAGLPVFPGQPVAAMGTGAAPVGPNTTLAVVGTNAALTPAECRRLATASHAGLARALDPSHTSVDGDTIFALATGAVPLAPVGDVGRTVAHVMLQAAAAEAVRLAILDGVARATPVETPAGRWDPYPLP